MPCLGTALAALNVNAPPFSLREAARRLEVTTEIRLSKVFREIQSPLLPCDAELFPDYFPEDLQRALDALSSTFEISAIHADPPGATPDPAEINRARKRLHILLKSALPPMIAQFYLQFRKRAELQDAQSFLSAMRTTPAIQNLVPLTREEVSLAQIRSPVPFVKFGGGPVDRDGDPIEIRGVLKPYTGPEINADGALLLQEFALAGREKAFRLNLWEAEIAIGLKQASRAMQLYKKARNDVRPTDPRRRVASLRLGFAHLVLGDELYQSNRVVTDGTAAAAAEQYTLARDEAARGPLGNPQIREVENYARIRLESLDRRLNFLGLSNHHLPGNPGFLNSPDGRPGRLAQARASVGAASALRDRFVNYLQAAESAELAKQEAAAAVKEANDTLSITEAKLKTADAQAELVSQRAELTRDRLETAKVSEYVEIYAKAAEFAGKSATGSLSVSDVAGLVTFGLEKRARFRELTFQAKETTVELQVVRSQHLIATIEHNIARGRAQFLERKQSFLSNARFNVDVYYDIALAYERLLERQIEDANRLAFFAERRAVFELGADGVNAPRVEFSFPRSDVDRVVDPDQLNLYLNELEQFFANSSEGRTQFLMTISLRNQFPLEFARFIETGRAVFDISIADLDRHIKGTTSHRIKSVKVTIDGIGTGVVNLSGHLRHGGAFLLRDQSRTLLSDSLLPRDDEIDEAVVAAQRGVGTVIGAGGVTFWQTTPATMLLVPASSEDPSINELRHYGFSGTWEFQFLPEDNPQVDFDLIADVIISMSGECIQPDAQTEAKVRRLLDDFRQEEHGDEPLDRTAVLSMNRSLPGTLEQLGQGAASMEITNVLIGRDITNARVKAVVFRAVDAAQQGIGGVHLTISSSDGSLALTRTTGEDGFSEPLDQGIEILSPANRVPLPGTWRAEAPVPADLEPVDDLAWFFLYTP